MQLTMDFVQTRARRSDPLTSHQAAKRSAHFAESHAGRILAVLDLHGPMSAYHIGNDCGLSVVQVDRRLPELQRLGLARPTGAVVSGCRVWEVVD